MVIVVDKHVGDNGVNYVDCSQSIDNKIINYVKYYRAEIYCILEP